MKQLTILLWGCSLLLLSLVACSQNDTEPTDSIPPSKVYLTPHLGDPGDSDDPNHHITDANNGIDAEPSGSLDYNWIKIQWNGQPLEKDGDIHHIDIYRFATGSQDTLRIEQLLYHPDSTRYVDQFINMDVGEIIQRNWNYFIIPVDEADNATESDTVSYYLINKPHLEFPAAGSHIDTQTPTDFVWGGTASYSCRFLLFDQQHTLQFATDLIPGSLSCTLPELFTGSGFYPIPGHTYSWRIDAFGHNGGSESEERTITFE